MLRVLRDQIREERAHARRGVACEYPIVVKDGTEVLGNERRGVLVVQGEYQLRGLAWGTGRRDERAQVKEDMEEFGARWLRARGSAQ